MPKSRKIRGVVGHACIGASLAIMVHVGSWLLIPAIGISLLFVVQMLLTVVLAYGVTEDETLYHAMIQMGEKQETLVNSGFLDESCNAWRYAETVCFSAPILALGAWYNDQNLLYFGMLAVFIKGMYSTAHNRIVDAYNRAKNRN